MNLSMKLPKVRVIIASDVSGDRDGIGVEIYHEDKIGSAEKLQTQ